MANDINKIAKSLKKSIQTDTGTKAYDTPARVIRIENGTAWVHIPGGVDETPVKLTINAKAGDMVQIRVAGGRAWIVGNATAPPTDDTTAVIARIKAITAQETADDAYGRAKEAGLLAGRAYDLASSAKTSADGKNTIYRQAAQPSGGTYVAGDVWFDSDDDNKIYRYNGSSWAPVTLGDDALASLSANKITAGTIDASVITVSNLDAGNITTGVLDADILMATDLTAHDLSAWRATIGGFHIGTDGLFSPPLAYFWDCTTSAAERSALNTALGLSEDTSAWAYDDLTASEMSTLNSLLALSEAISTWETDVNFSEYRTLCKILNITLEMGESVYLGTDAVNLGNNFYVDSSGILEASNAVIYGTIYASAGSFTGDVVANSLTLGSGAVVPSTKVSGLANVARTGDYADLAGSPDLTVYIKKDGTIGSTPAAGVTGFKVSSEGLLQASNAVIYGTIYASSGKFSQGVSVGGFDIVAASNGRDYLKSDYTTGGYDYRTWIRSAEVDDKGNTWAFSVQRRNAGSAELYNGMWYVTSNGDMSVAGKVSGIYFTSSYSVELVIDAGGRETYNPGATVGSDYNAVALMRFSTNKAAVVIAGWDVNYDGSMTIYVKNVGSTQVTVTVSVQVLWLKKPIS